MKNAVFGRLTGAGSYRGLAGSSLRQGPVSPLHDGLRDKRKTSVNIYAWIAVEYSANMAAGIDTTRWCNGNTRVFGTRIPGSSPGRVDWFVAQTDR